MPRILVINDDHAFRWMLLTALAGAAMTVLEATNGAEGVQTGVPVRPAGS